MMAAAAQIENATGKGGRRDSESAAVVASAEQSADPTPHHAAATHMMPGIESLPSLDAPYMYQNPRTGSASSAPLTVRQLCRLLCPPSAAAKSASVVSPDTPVIAYDPVSGQYSAQGWVAARTVPVLREAGAMWYYEAPASRTESRSGDISSASSSSTTTTSSNRIMGPVSARELSKLLIGNDDDNICSSIDGIALKQTAIVGGLTRVYSSDITEAVAQGSVQQPQPQPQWRSIAELPTLRMALDAFESSNPQWAEPSNEEQQQTMNNDRKNNMEMEHDHQQQQQAFDPSLMTFDAGDAEGSTSTHLVTATTAPGLSQQEADDLEAFLNSTAKAGKNAAGGHDGEEEEGEEYESDGGTRYVLDPQTGSWIHETLAPRKKTASSSTPPSNSATNMSSSDRTVHHANKTPRTTGKGNTGSNNEKAPQPVSGARKRKKKGRFSAKNAKCWVYVTGLPFDADEDEIASYFGKVGVLDLDPETQHPKIKLYRRRKGDASGPEGSLKGDASVCYARAESVDLALQFLDDSYLRADSKEKLRVQRAKFEQHGDKFEDRGRISNAKRKVAKLAALQAVGWDEGENGRITGGRKGLCIIVLKGMFDLVELQNEGEDEVLSALEQDIRKECIEWGDVEKITAFSKNPEGVVVIKFGQPTAASTAVSHYHGRMRKGRKIDASFWDGVTDYTVREEEKEKKEESKRLDDFGKWLDNQDLPEELRLKVEG